MISLYFLQGEYLDSRNTGLILREADASLLNNDVISKMAQQTIIQFQEEITLIVNDWNLQVFLYRRNKIHVEK
jgi:hypothetical protein